MAAEPKAPLIVATEPAHFIGFAELCRAYVDWCRIRYADMTWFVEQGFGHQSLDEELSELETKYARPDGLILLAERDGGIVAGGAFRPLSETVCELKRVFVSDKARGTGLGRTLVCALVDAARSRGYQAMRLDTADRLNEAITLYETLDFKPIAPFHDYPPQLVPHLVFMEKQL